MLFSRILKCLTIPILFLCVLMIVSSSKNQRIAQAKAQLLAKGFSVKELYRFNPIRESRFKPKYVFDTEELCITQHNISSRQKASEIMEELKLLSPRISNIGCSGTSFTDQDAVLLTQMPKLGVLAIDGSELSNRGLATLSKLEHLTGITIHGLQITEQEPDWLANNSNLQAIRLHKCQIGPNTFRQLSKLTNLTRIKIPHTNVTSADLQYLTNHPRLSELILPGSEIDDRAAAHLKQMKSLQRLDLSNTEVGDEVCKQIAQLNQLIYLNLDKTNVTDSGAQAIMAGCWNLKYLSFNDCEISIKAFPATQYWPPNLNSLTLANTSLTSKEILQLYSEHSSLAHLNYDWAPESDPNHQKYIKIENSRMSQIQIEHNRNL
ncbi:Internalin-A precursor [Gimesia panareensis]|uniref:Internalin-A n=2 Tax=Gimesia panareensis TaxID=2527978 RepID=A0A518FUE8_9PLAN|nr:Internalin-A precursor [Gimesia panareensis]